jgi:AraC-like DNA-binding protein
VQVLREHFTADDRSAPAWFRASGDPHVGSEFAFAAAFKRHHGAAPGRWRTAKRAAA